MFKRIKKSFFVESDFILNFLFIYSKLTLINFFYKNKIEIVDDFIFIIFMT